jgi:hypothetical protein
VGEAHEGARMDGSPSAGVCVRMESSPGCFAHISLAELANRMQPDSRSSRLLDRVQAIMDDLYVTLIVAVVVIDLGSEYGITVQNDVA